LLSIFQEFREYFLSSVKDIPGFYTLIFQSQGIFRIRREEISTEDSTTHRSHRQRTKCSRAVKLLSAHFPKNPKREFL